MLWRLKRTFTMSTTSRYRFRHEKQLEISFPLNVVVVPAQIELKEGNPIRFTFTIYLHPGKSEGSIVSLALRAESQIKVPSIAWNKRHDYLPHR